MLKFGSQANSNMQNSNVMFTFSVFDQKYCFWVNLLQKVRIVSLSRNLTPMLIWICKIQWWCSFFQFSTKNYFSGGNLVQKIKTVSLSRNLVSTLIRICATQRWCWRFLFSTKNVLFGKILFWKTKIVSLSWNLVLRLILVWRIQCWCSGNFAPKNQYCLL